MQKSGLRSSKNLSLEISQVFGKFIWDVLVGILPWFFGEWILIVFSGLE